MHDQASGIDVGSVMKIGIAKSHSLLMVSQKHSSDIPLNGQVMGFLYKNNV
jgi:hypothetical protein